ncbi:MAG: hypothetical protein HY075_00275 [Deltaproteobacteria bacterium]|nr:hypothetical protein [Deltaproteobacteria bacterium]
MKFGFAILSLVFLAQPSLADDGCQFSHDWTCETQNIPDFWDGLNGVTLQKELAKPEHFPAYLYKPAGSSHTKIGRFFIDRRYPVGPIRCEHFEIHDAKSDDALKWESLDTSASNVYWHLHRAIDYFNRLSAETGEAIYQEKRPIVIRVHMDTDWAMWIKFTNSERYNTSQTFPDVEPEKWGTPEEQREIWFFIPKRHLMPKWVIARYIPGLKNTIFGTTGFPLDSAHVPSIIYHEWVHLMTRQYLGIDKDTPLNEGYSDYFGSVIWGRPAMGDTEEFSSFPYDRDFAKSPDQIYADDVKTPGDFVPRFFWSLRKQFGPRVDALLWKSLKLLSPKSTLLDLPRAILATAGDRSFAPDEVAAMEKQMRRLFTIRKGRRGD